VSNGSEPPPRTLRGLLSAWDNVRTTAYRFARAASFGRCSQTRSPGTLVPIGRNSPRTSAGASGLGSNVSRWLDAPVRKTRTTDFGRFAGAARPVRVAATPSRAEYPTWESSRRFSPMRWACMVGLSRGGGEPPGQGVDLYPAAGPAATGIGCG
jgi:hypothetical protein